MTEIDLLSHEAVNDPHAYFRGLRDGGPVQWSDRHRAWIVLGHPELEEAFRNPNFTTERMESFSARLSDSRRDALARAIELLDGWMLFHEPPTHTRLRAPFSRAFTPKTVKSLEADVVSITEGLLDRIPINASFDLVSSFAHQLPAAVIARLFGVPDELGDWLREWSARFGVVVFGATRRADYEEVARAAGTEFQDHMRSILDDRRANPRNDLASILVSMENEPGGLTTMEIIGACSLLLFAGHDTTSSFIGSATLALLDDPNALEAMRAEGCAVDPAVEELLRFETSAKAMMRQVKADHVFAGKEVKAGEAVFLTIMAANRDPRVFEEPDRLDLARNPNPHLAFGFGHHFCLGAALARLESRIAIPALVRRFPNLRLDGQVTWKPNISDRSALHIPLHT
jgi:cytochrome P450